jgi:hypothetical protein
MSHPSEVDGVLLDRAILALDRLRPWTFDLAESPSDRDEVLRMRYRCVIEEGWARPEDHPDGREHDEDDEGALFVVCRDGASMIGSMRIVLPRAGRLLPIEREFGIRARPVGGVFEVGRLIVDPVARSGRSPLIMAGLSGRGWIEALARGLRRGLATATPEVVDLYRSVGLRVSVLGPARSYWGLRRAPIQVEGDLETFAFVSA